MDALSDRHEITVLTSSTGQEHVARAEEGVLRTLPFIRQTKGDSLRAARLAVGAVRATREALEQADPDLIFIFNGAGVPRSALRVLELTGVPVVWSVGEHWFTGIYRHDQFTRHLYLGERGLRGVWASGMRQLNRHHPSLQIDLDEAVPAAVMWNTEIMRTFIPVPPTTLPVLERVIYPGTRHEELYSSLERAPGAVPTIAFVGRLEPEKGPDIAVHALAGLERKYGIVARLVMCGSVEPAKAKSIEALARSLGVARGVELRGFLPPSDLGDVLSSAHVVLLPYVWEEPLGLVCVEAGLARAPWWPPSAAACPRSCATARRRCSSRRATWMRASRPWPAPCASPRRRPTRRPRVRTRPRVRLERVRGPRRRLPVRGPRATARR